MRSRQAGITFIGWIFLLAPVAIVAYAVIRLTPVYLNSMKVSKVINQTADEYKGESQPNPRSVGSALQRRYDVEGITFPAVSDITLTREGTEWVLSTVYEDKVPLFAGISLLVSFDKRAVVE